MMAEKEFARKSLLGLIEANREMEDFIRYGTDRFYIPGVGLRLPAHYKLNQSD